MDSVARQTFTQESREKWNYLIESNEGKVYKVHYEVKPFGYCSEKFYEGTFLIWDREFKIGEFLTPTVLEVIKKGNQCHAI